MVLINFVITKILTTAPGDSPIKAKGHVDGTEKQKALPEQYNK
jgi:hypothetical protein